MSKVRRDKRTNQPIELIQYSASASTHESETVSRGRPRYQQDAIHSFLLIFWVVGGDEGLYAQPQPAWARVHHCRRQEYNYRGHRGHDATQGDRVARLAAGRGAGVRRGVGRCEAPFVEVDEQRGGAPEAERRDDGLARRAVEAVALLDGEHVRAEDEGDAQAEVVRLRHPRPLTRVGLGSGLRLGLELGLGMGVGVEPGLRLGLGLGLGLGIGLG